MGSSKERPSRSGRSPVVASMISRASAMAESILSPRISILIRPTSSRESLSHWVTARLGMVAGSLGTISIRGEPVMIIPPLWMERCRGKPSICQHRSKSCCQGRWLLHSLKSPQRQVTRR